MNINTVADLLLILSLVGLIAGLVKPQLMQKLTKGTHPRKKIGLVFGIGIVLALVILLANAPTNTPLRKDLAFQGDAAYCDGIYKTDGNSTVWTLHIKQQGELITHLSGKGSNQMYRHDDQVKPGYYTYTAPVSINDVAEINGLLYVGQDNHSCNINPQQQPQQNY